MEIILFQKSLAVCLAVLLGAASVSAQDPPPFQEYFVAERGARLVLKKLGLSTGEVYVTYGRLPNQDAGLHRAGSITFNPFANQGTIDMPMRVVTGFHEFWHYQQDQLEGRTLFEEQYNRIQERLLAEAREEFKVYEARTATTRANRERKAQAKAWERNPYEREAKLIGEWLTQDLLWSGINVYNRPKSFDDRRKFEDKLEKWADQAVAKLPGVIRKDVRKIWAEYGTTPLIERRLTALETGWVGRGPKPQAVASTSAPKEENFFKRLFRIGQSNVAKHGAKVEMREQGASAAKFGAAYPLKEGFRAVETGDPEVILQAGRDMATVDFWAGVGVFSAGATGANRALQTGIVTRRLTPGVVKHARGPLALAAGMAGLQAFTSGRVDGRELAISTGAYSASTVVVSNLADRVVRPSLFRVLGRTGTAALGPRVKVAYDVTTLAFSLFLGEKIDRAVNEAIVTGNRNGTQASGE